jgi:hypothetical protein
MLKINYTKWPSAVSVIRYEQESHSFGRAVPDRNGGFDGKAASQPCQNQKAWNEDSVGEFHQQLFFHPDKSFGDKPVASCQTVRLARQALALNWPSCP